MLGLRHAAEGRDDVVDREDAVRQAGAACPARSRRPISWNSDGDHGRLLPHRPVEVDGDERQVLLERPHAQPAVHVNVALADLQEPAVVAEDAQALGDRLAGERVQDHVDALAVGLLHHLVGEGQRPRVHDVLDADRLQEVSLLGRPGGGEDLGPRPLGQLDRRQADAAGRRVDQDPLTLFEAGEVIQGVVGRQEGDRDGRRFLERDAGGLLGDEREVGGCVVAEAERRDRHHLVADGQARDAFAHGRDPPGALDAERHGAVGQARIEAQRLHDVAEVEGGRHHLDLDLVRTRRLAVDLPERQAVEDAEARRFQPVGRLEVAIWAVVELAIAGAAGLGLRALDEARTYRWT